MSSHFPMKKGNNMTVFHDHFFFGLLSHCFWLKFFKLQGNHLFFGSICLWNYYSNGPFANWTGNKMISLVLKLFWRWNNKWLLSTTFFCSYFSSVNRFSPPFFSFHELTIYQDMIFCSEGRVRTIFIFTWNLSSLFREYFPTNHNSAFL